MTHQAAALTPDSLHSEEEILLTANCGNRTHNGTIGVERAISRRRAMLCGAQTILSSLTDSPNKQSVFKKKRKIYLQYSAPPVGTNMLLYLSRLLLMNMLGNAEQRMTAPIVRTFRVIFTHVKVVSIISSISNNWIKRRWRKHDVRGEE